MHLQDERLLPDAAGVVKRAQAAHVTELCCNGTRPQDWPEVLELARRYPCILPFTGLHPWHIDDASDAWADELETVVSAHPCGIGEIGLDFVKSPERDRQKEVFERQLELARRYARPVSIHCVRAWAALTESLRKSSPLPAGFMVHAFNGSAEIGRELIKIGGYLSFCATAFAENKRLKTRELLTSLPLDRILFETESPFGWNEGVLFLPVGHNEVNEPANLPLTVQEAAALTGQNAGEFANMIYENGKRFIGPLKGAGA